MHKAYNLVPLVVLVFSSAKPVRRLAVSRVGEGRANGDDSQLKAKLGHSPLILETFYGSMFPWCY